MNQETRIHAAKPMPGSVQYQKVDAWRRRRQGNVADCDHSHTVLFDERDIEIGVYYQIHNDRIPAAGECAIKRAAAALVQVSDVGA